MKKLFLFLLLLSFLRADEEVSKVVFDLTTSNLKTFETKVLKAVERLKTHYEGNLKEIEIAFVIHGGAYRFFVKDPLHSPFKEDKKLMQAYPDLKKRISSLVDLYGVEFLMCKAALGKNKLREDDIYPFVLMVPNSMIGLIDKQGEGFGYIPIP